MSKAETPFLEGRTFKVIVAALAVTIVIAIIVLATKVGSSSERIDADTRAAFDAYLKEVAKHGEFAMMLEDWESAGRPAGPPARTTK